MRRPGYRVPVPTPPDVEATVTAAEFAARLGLSRPDSLDRVRDLPAPDAPSRKVQGRWVRCWQESTVAEFVPVHAARGGRAWRAGRTGPIGR